jgi:hypothetical protein
MQRETGVAPDHVIQLPVIFAPKEPDFGPARLGAQALTGNLVNLLMSNNSCVMPAAFGPVEDGMDRFEKYSTEQILRKNGDLSVHYLDNWYKYHLDGGSMHCGTQTHRRPADMHAWLRDSEMWWNFRP